MTIDEKLAYLKGLLLEAEFKESDDKALMFQSVRNVFRYPADFYNLPTRSLDRCVDNLKDDIVMINKLRESIKRREVLKGRIYHV